jgi:pyrimidine operon attenuation protein/uracil phosphoribosyltransferase
MNKLSEKEILGGKEMRRVIRRIANEIVESNQGTDGLVLVGIRTRGVPLAERLAKEIMATEEGADIPVGVLDITMYRDDLEQREEQPMPGVTRIDFDVDDHVVVLVDDVLYTGRSIRAAFDAISDLGRPRVVRLAVLVDRGRREYPIQPDFTGRKVPTSKYEQVVVHLKETDGKDEVLLRRENE